MRASAAALAILTCGACLGVVACGGSNDEAPPPRRPHADPGTVRDPHVAGEAGVGQAPAGPVRDPGAALPRDRPGERLLERRRRLLRHRRRRLRQADDGDPACRLRDGRPARRSSTSSSKKPVDLPPRPLLLTFDDARADSWTGGDGILREAALHTRSCSSMSGVSTPATPSTSPGRSSETAQDSGRWQLQLHSGKGHTQIQLRPGSTTTTGRSTPTRSRARTSTAGANVCGPTSSGARRRSPTTSPAYKPLAFAPPYGSYGQDGTNDPKIPDDLLGWLIEPLRRASSRRT